ncbi:MAG TPA: DUF2231 domain-containing protein [Blastocatellia bacterium]|nr:DUF2231 domain-containing protein [Blastocatellia bacterium]
MKKGLRLLGHPLHASLIHFPIAFLGTSLIWDVIGVMRTEAIWWTVSFWGISFGLVCAGAAATAGFVDYTAIEQADPAQRTATRHMMLMMAAVSLYSTSLIVRQGSSRPAGISLIAVFVLEGAGALLLGAGGRYGGHLVYHHGVGRDPES